MPPLATAADFLILEFIAGNRRTPHVVCHNLLDSLFFPSASRHTSQRLQQALVLRALDAALLTEGASCSSSLLLKKARKVLADPDAAAYFPHQIAFTGNEENDEARAAAAVADLKRLLDLEWDNLPPSTLELAADTIAVDGTWAAADNTKRTKLHPLEESTERENLAKLAQDGSPSHQPILTEVAGNVSDANEADGARRDDEAHSRDENNEADRGQGMAGHQNASVKGATEKSVPAFKKSSLLERNPNARTSEWDSSDDDQPVRKRKSHPSDDDQPLRNRKSHPSDDDQPVRKHKSHPSDDDQPVRNRKSHPSDDDQPVGKSKSHPSDDDQPVRKRQSHPSERKPYPHPTCAHKIRKKWSEIEEKTLLEGVEKYGKGNWKDIKIAYPDVFEERSTVDLKDKFRNLDKQREKSA